MLATHWSSPKAREHTIIHPNNNCADFRFFLKTGSESVFFLTNTYLHESDLDLKNRFFCGGKSQNPAQRKDLETTI